SSRSAEPSLKSSPPNSGASSLTKICSRSMSCFFANVARQIGTRLQRGSPRDSNRSGTATIREADTETARPGHQIIRLAVIFVHLFSHNMTSSNRTVQIDVEEGSVAP